MAMGGRTGDIFTDINVTPLTDVFLVLLVIMILVAPLVNQTVLKVDPPQASSSQQKNPEPEKNKIDVEVLGSGQVKVNGPPPSVTLGAGSPILVYGQQTTLTGTVSSGAANEPVIITAKPYGAVTVQQVATRARVRS